MSNIKEMVNWINEERESSKQEVLQEVLEWLEELTIDDADGYGHSIVSFKYFDYKEQMLQSFKEQFNIE